MEIKRKAPVMFCALSVLPPTMLGPIISDDLRCVSNSDGRTALPLMIQVLRDLFTAAAAAATRQPI